MDVLDSREGQDRPKSNSPERDGDGATSTSIEPIGDNRLTLHKLALALRKLDYRLTQLERIWYGRFDPDDEPEPGDASQA